jgi:PAS domain S-box-containing protein
VASPDDRSTGGERAARSDCILLVMADDPARAALADYLSAVPGYEVLTGDPDGAVPAAYDLCLLDAAALDRAGETIAVHRRDDPAVRPTLLVYRDGRVPDVDDVVSLDTPWSVLRRRIDGFLRTRRLSARLAERDHQYRQLVDLAPEAILLVRDGRVTYGNAAAADLFGVDGTEGRPVTDLLPDSTDPTALEDVLSTVATEGRLDGYRDLSLRSAAGDAIDARVAGVAVTHDGEPSVQLVVRDVTEERAREERLTLFGRAIEATVQGITIADARRPDDPLIYANAAFERITGYPVDEVLGRNCRFLQGEGTDPETVAEVRAAVEARRPVATELLNYRKDGTPFWNRLEIVPIAADDGTVTHFLGLQRDVTDRREREERLSVMDRVLRHNIRNRVNVIQGTPPPCATVRTTSRPPASTPPRPTSSASATRCADSGASSPSGTES